MTLALDPAYVQAVEPLEAAHSDGGQVVAAHDIETRRASINDSMELLMAARETHADVVQSTISIKSYDGANIDVIHVRRQGAESGPPTPAVIHAHGGGMIAGTASLYVKPIDNYAHHSGLQFFSVDYRLAPEHPHPTPVEDCYAALRYISDNAQIFNIDPARLAVLGESAGGGIAAGMALLARDRGLTPPLAKQILIYPMLDDRNVEPIELLDPFAVWSSVDNLTGWTALLGRGKVGKDHYISPYAAPARAPSVAGLPSTYIDVGELDIFRDEDMEYSMRLSKAGVSTEFHLYPGLPHGFDLMAPSISVVRRAIENRLKAMASV